MAPSRCSHPHGRPLYCDRMVAHESGPKPAEEATIMRTRTRFIITGAATLAILGLGTAGAVAMTNSLGITEQAGQVQKIDSVTTGRDGSGSDDSTSSPTPTPTPSTSTDPSGTSTVEPAAPVYIDDHGGDRPDGVSDDGPNHDLGDDHGGNSGSGSSGSSGSDDSGSGHGGSGGHGSDD